MLVARLAPQDLQLLGDAIKWQCDSLELPAQQYGQEQGMNFYYCVHNHSGFMVKILLLLKCRWW